MNETAREWIIEQTSNERILCYWYTPVGGNRMKREVAVLCDWNGKDDQEKDEKLVLDAMHDSEFSHLRNDCDYRKVSDELNHASQMSGLAQRAAEKIVKRFEFDEFGTLANEVAAIIDQEGK